MNDYSLLFGTPTGAALDLFSTVRESCFTASFGRWRGRLNQSPPSTTMVVPLMYLPLHKKKKQSKLHDKWNQPKEGLSFFLLVFFVYNKNHIVGIQNCFSYKKLVTEWEEQWPKKKRTWKGQENKRSKKTHSKICQELQTSRTKIYKEQYTENWVKDNVGRPPYDFTGRLLEVAFLEI